MKILFVVALFVAVVGGRTRKPPTAMPTTRAEGIADVRRENARKKQMVQIEKLLSNTVMARKKVCDAVKNEGAATKAIATSEEMNRKAERGVVVATKKYADAEKRVTEYTLKQSAALKKYRATRSRKDYDVYLAAVKAVQDANYKQSAATKNLTAARRASTLAASAVAKAKGTLTRAQNMVLTSKRSVQTALYSFRAELNTLMRTAGLSYITEEDLMIKSKAAGVIAMRSRKEAENAKKEASRADKLLDDAQEKYDKAIEVRKDANNQVRKARTKSAREIANKLYVAANKKVTEANALLRDRKKLYSTAMGAATGLEKKATRDETQGLTLRKKAIAALKDLKANRRLVSEASRRLKSVSRRQRCAERRGRKSGKRGGRKSGKRRGRKSNKRRGRKSGKGGKRSKRGRRQKSQ